MPYSEITVSHLPQRPMSCLPFSLSPSSLPFPFGGANPGVVSLSQTFHLCN